ncbi:endolytic transglycosylase MltG [Marinobacterium rhizophilum]|uniref:Endolytic murein transglycosylase n=1 Tax=Marinobacterium rhizophilum TaxID=420402 RepID=A0ABY5HMH7_9GAMM|nr:endolytic transglycosylase MltG [Marinobacterium rhizophilum]UTW13510.1 endolytic transglycosylase MltG [Marinobacterium rhizophilum]
MRLLFGGALLTLLLLAIAWQRINAYVDSPLPVAEPRTLVIERGQGFNQIAADLEAATLVQRPLLLRIFARVQGVAHRVKAGEYAIEPGLTLRGLLQKMVDGDTLRHFFTVVEGTSFVQLREQLAANPVLLQTLTELDDSEIMALLGEPDKHPEGLFLAETYQFLRGMSDLDLLRRARTSLDAALVKAWEERQPELPYGSAYEGLIMASIIEKETAVPDERPRISGVFVRRLQQGMRLQTDPTVIYGMGDAYKGNLRRSDLLKKTPYNTYAIEGLPPTPIAMVGEAAITAALNPEAGPWLFFVAKGDGSHHFSARLSEHNSAVRRYQLKRREDYRSTPEG